MLSSCHHNVHASSDCIRPRAYPVTKVDPSQLPMTVVLAFKSLVTGRFRVFTTTYWYRPAPVTFQGEIFKI